MWGVVESKGFCPPPPHVVWPEARIQIRFPDRLASVSPLAMRPAHAWGIACSFLPCRVSFLENIRNMTLHGVFHPRARIKLQANLYYTINNDEGFRLNAKWLWVMTSVVPLKSHIRTVFVPDVSARRQRPCL